MKKETLEKANKLQNRIYFVETALKKLDRNDRVITVILEKKGSNNTDYIYFFEDEITATKLKEFLKSIFEDQLKFVETEFNNLKDEPN